MSDPTVLATEMVRVGVQAQRDALELHQSLTEAVRRMSAARRVLADRPGPNDVRVLCEVTLSTRDLMEVLTRTARESVG
jgi:hypothetical protein